MVSMPDNVVLYRDKSPNFKSYSIAVGENFVSNIQMQWKAEIYMLIKENPCISLSDGDMNMLIDMCDTLQSKYARLDHPYRNKICEHQLLVISYEIAGLYSKYRPLEKASQTRKHQILQQFLMLVANNYTKSRKVEFYAEKMCMTPKYLSSSVKEASDVSATQWIARTVISNAKYLLSRSELSVQQISDQLNFPNPSFSDSISNPTVE
jgi:AraC-type DNA-binding domain-containing proteins